MKRNSPLVLGASRIIQKAQNMTDLAIRQFVMPAETALRKLSRDELTSLSKVFLGELDLKQRFSPEELQAMGYNTKQLIAYNDLRRMFTETLKQENEARALKGQKPITELEYYSSARWKGDFRQDFRDANDKHVWSLAGTSAKDLARQRAALLQQFPDLKPSVERIVRTSRDGVSPAELYKHMLDILGEGDPAVARIKQ